MRQLEKGQAIVIVALYMVILLFFGGLAIDGGDLLWLYNDVWNATDAAAKAAANDVCSGGDGVTLGLQLATANGFTEDELKARYRTIAVDVTVTEVTNQYGVPGYDVEVYIKAEKKKYFIQLIYGGPLETSVRAIEHCDSSYMSAAGSVITGLRGECENAVDLSGSDITITGGILSAESIKISTSSGTIIGEGYYTTIYEGNENTLWNPSGTNPAPAMGPIYDDMPWEIEQFLPGGVYYEQALSEGLLHIETGSYVATNETLEGLYLLTGSGDFRSVGISNTIGPRGLTVVTTAGGAIHFSGRDLSNLNPYINNGKNGLLLYSTAVTSCGGNGILFDSSRATYSGDIYAPQSGCNISDSENSGFDVRIVCGTVNISSSDTNIGNEHVYSPLMPPTQSKTQ